MSIAQFIAYRQTNPRQKRPRPRVTFHKAANGELIRTESFISAPDGVHARSLHNTGGTGDIHLAEGTLQIQQSLLLHVARLENTAKGYSNDGPNPSQHQSRGCMTEAEQAKRELSGALYTIWNSKQKQEVKGLESKS